MKTPLSWRNVWHNKVRSLVALCGIMFAILLIFMELGFYGAARTNATAVYDMLDFDVAVVSPECLYLGQLGDLPRHRFEEIRSINGVESLSPLWLQVGRWRNSGTREDWDMLALGIEPSDRPFQDSALNDRLPEVAMHDRALSDSVSRSEYGTLTAGAGSELVHQRIRIVGQFTMGAGFVAGSAIITSRQTFLDVFREASHERPNIGLIKIAPNASPRKVASEITARMSPVAIALTRSEFLNNEQAFWLKVKPIGIMFHTGVFVAVIAGIVILYQVLVTEVQTRIREYSTLKALGYQDRFVYGVVVRQGLIYSWLAFIPAFFFSLVLYFFVRMNALVPIRMDTGRVGTVLVLTALMCLCATLLGLRKLQTSDPADLF
jgi:putative ABC transport system permease protein